MAKIKRFNEIPVATPSPAEYNVDLKHKPKMGVIPQSERFTESKSPPVSDTESTQSTPCFRTPTLIKRKKLVSSASKPKPQNLMLTDKELFNEKVVECRNKDTFIKELTEQLEDLKNKMYNLNCTKEQLDEEKRKFEEKMSDIQRIHNVKIESISKNHETEISNLNDSILKIQEELNLVNQENKKLIDTLEKLQNESKHEIEMCVKEIEAKNETIKNLEINLKQIEEEKHLAQDEHKLKLAEICSKHKEEMENLEFGMLKCVHDIQKSLDDEKRQNQLKITELQNYFEKEIESLKQSFSNEKEFINNQNAARIKQLEENMAEMKVFSEIQAKEKCAELENYWQSRLEKQEHESSAILKECQAISEYNIIQSEIEKNDFKSKFEMKTKKYNDLERKYDDVYFNYKQLQTSYSNVQNKLYRLIKELREKEELKKQFNKLLSEKQTYETTILRCQQTIDILKRRLTESDQDVEQLKNEISDNEKKLLEYEHKLNILSTELKETQAFNDELEMNNESTIKITQEEIKTIKEDLIKRVEDFKIKVEKDQITHKAELETKNLEKLELLKMIEEQQVLNKDANKLINQADVELERLTSENCDISYQLEILNRKNAVLQSSLDDCMKQKEQWAIDKKELDLKMDILKSELDRLRKQENDWKNSSAKMVQLEIICEDFEKNNSEKSFKISELEKAISKLNEKYDNLQKINMQHEKTIEEQKALIAPFKEQLESYELEMSNLQNAKDHMENEAKDLGIKYAEILGHQNHKQKIKYMVNLKSRNEELIKANLDLESKMRVQDKKMEKLKKENIELKRSLRKPSIFEDKENMASPNRSFKCESPGPLRELN